MIGQRRSCQGVTGNKWISPSVQNTKLEYNMGKTSRPLLSCDFVLNVPQFHYIDCQLSDRNTTQILYRTESQCCVCILSFTSNQRSHNLNLSLMVDQYGQLHLQHKPWTNWENIILSIKADRIMSHSKWKVELVKPSLQWMHCRVEIAVVERLMIVPPLCFP